VLENSQLAYRAHILELLQELSSIGLQLHIVSGGISDLIHSSLVSIAGKELIENVVTIHSNAWEIYLQGNSK
jgi:2-hydroxy-3-keto-5-methylthiopentenyl-1-phosphate phosphatase